MDWVKWQARWECRGWNGYDKFVDKGERSGLLLFETKSVMCDHDYSMTRRNVFHSSYYYDSIDTRYDCCGITRFVIACLKKKILLMEDDWLKDLRGDVYRCII